MQNVSSAYKSAMKNILRERSYIRVLMGIVNYEAQDESEISHGAVVPFSSDSIIGSMSDNNSYAGFDCCIANGTQLLLPESEEEVLDTGLISDLPVNQSPFEITVSFSSPVDIKGLTLNFDDNVHATSFIIESENKVSYYNNESSEFVTEDAFDGVTYLKFTFSSMSIPTARLRLRRILLGYGLSYTNNDIIDSEWKSSVSEIADELPMVDVSVTLKNFDQYFDYNNPSSTLNYLDSTMPIQIQYGMTLDNGSIEWIPVAKCYISEWSADNKTATIKGFDVLRTMEDTYNRGRYYPNGISLFDLAEQVCADAGITEYRIDPYLKGIFTKNPLPRVAHKEALQIIANAGRCTLTIDRNGVPNIVSSFIPEISISANEEAEWSNVENILTNDPKDRYTLFYTNFISANDEHSILPPDEQSYSAHTGFISASISKEDRTFDTNPIITIRQDVSATRSGLVIRFGQVIPSECNITTYSDGVQQEQFIIKPTEKLTRFNRLFLTFDTMNIIFVKTSDPFQPIDIEYIGFEAISDFVFESNDMMSYPVGINDMTVKRIDTVVSMYSESDVVDTLSKGEITVSSGDKVQIYFDNPCYDYSAEIESGELCEVTDSGAYFAEVTFYTEGTFELIISGRKYNVSTTIYSKNVRQRGETKTWENPLISDLSMASELTEWLHGYYLYNLTYSFNTRGNPEIDPNDVIYQWNKFVKDMPVRLRSQTVRFNGALSGTVNTRRITDERLDNT